MKIITHIDVSINKPGLLAAVNERCRVPTLLAAGVVTLGFLCWGTALAASKKPAPVTAPSPAPIIVAPPVTAPSPAPIIVVPPVAAPSPSPVSVVAPVSSPVPDSTVLNSPLGGAVSQSSSAALLDPSKLGLKTGSDANVYFMGASAEFQKTLGLKSNGKGNSALLFPDASSVLSKYLSSGGGSLASPGIVNLGNLDVATALDFFLDASGASKGQLKSLDKKVLSSEDLTQVVASAYALKDSPFLIVGFKNLLGKENGAIGGLQFGVDVGSSTIQALTATPEPSTWAMLGSLVLVVWRFRRNRASAAAID